MNAYHCTLGRRQHSFRDLKDLLAKASPARSGDQLAGIAAESAEQRVAAQMTLADVPLASFLEEPLIGYEEDEVTRLILDEHDAEAFQPVAGLTTGEFRDWLLSYDADGEMLRRLAPGLTPEMVAAVSKIMREPGSRARRLESARSLRAFRNTIGLRGRFRCAFSRITRPTTRAASPRRSSTACCYGCGDAVIGINPATDRVGSTTAICSS